MVNSTYCNDDYNMKIGGNMNLDVRGNKTETVSGSKTSNTTGNVIHRGARIDLNRKTFLRKAYLKTNKKNLNYKCNNIRRT